MEYPTPYFPPHTVQNRRESYPAHPPYDRIGANKCVRCDDRMDRAPPETVGVGQSSGIGKQCNSKERAGRFREK
ncbi:hypothetical protein J6590_015002 [Homalodisca vitripennis]|nr:hypothetical protein J6590_015002 [Homalodisca vitripennis]